MTEESNSFTFPFSAKLKSRKTIGDLFSSGKTYKAFPFKLLVVEASFEDQVTTKTAFSVPKRLFKHAVDRNKIKRLMREAYRLQKPRFEKELSSNNKTLALIFIYINKETPEFSLVQKKINILLERVNEDHKPTQTE